MNEKVLGALHEQYEAFKSSIKAEKVGSGAEPEWKALLEGMLDTLSGWLGALEGPGLRHRVVAMKGALHYLHAKVLVQLGQMEVAQETLRTCLELVKEYFLAPEVTFLGLRVLNHYCYLLTKCGDLDRAQELLELAEEKYLKLKERGDMSALPLYSNDDLFEGKLELTPNKEVKEKLEKLVTNNLQMLGYVYNKRGDLDRFALYHHRVLRRQLDMREGDATVWAMKTARLGYFFLTRNKFAQARHHLAAACYVLSQYESTLKTLETTDLVLSKWDELNHRYADIAKCWVRYGLFLFNASKMKLVSAFYGDSSPVLDGACTNPFDSLFFPAAGVEDNEDTSKWNGSEPKVHEEDLGEQPPAGGEDVPVFEGIFDKPRVVGAESGEEAADEGEGEEGRLRFPNLELSCLEKCVSCEYVDSLEAARALFLFTHSWLKKSKLFYTLKDHPMEYVNVILDLSELYRYLAFYEDDIENQYSVQKRRADTLETLSTVLKEAKPQCYIAISIELFRELAEIHLELMGLNLRRLYSAQGPEGPKQEEGKAPGDCTFHKMEALADVHRRLYQFSEVLGHGALDSGCGMAPLEGDAHDEPCAGLFEPYQPADMKLF